MHAEMPTMPPFIPAPLRRAKPLETNALWLATRPPSLFALRRLVPLLRWRDTVYISRFEDTQEALNRPDVFGVPWEAKMQLQASTRQPFILATDDPGEHACAQRRLMRVFRHGDSAHVAKLAGTEAQRIIDAADETIDGVKDLISKVPLRIYREHYGIEAPDDFVLWLMAISNFTFRQIGRDDEAKPIALAGIARLRWLVDQALQQAKKRKEGDTIADRMVRLQRAEGDKLPDDALHSAMVGMVAGNDPVATSAATNILEVLLARPKALAMTQQAARGDKDELLTRCLLEALRFWPINPGLWRICRSDYTVAAGTSRAKTIRRGEKVLVFLQAAMQDERQVRRPWSFDPDRPASDSMVFGYGMHWCIGAPLGVAQLTATLKPLLIRGFERAAGAAGRTRRFGAFPEHLELVLGRR